MTDEFKARVQAWIKERRKSRTPSKAEEELTAFMPGVLRLLRVRSGLDRDELVYRLNFLKIQPNETPPFETEYLELAVQALHERFDDMTRDLALGQLIYDLRRGAP